MPDIATSSVYEGSYMHRRNRWDLNYNLRGYSFTSFSCLPLHSLWKLLGSVLTGLFAILLLDLAEELLWGIVWRGVLPLLLAQHRKCGKVIKGWAKFFVKP